MVTVVCSKLNSTTHSSNQLQKIIVVNVEIRIQVFSVYIFLHSISVVHSSKLLINDVKPHH